MDKQTIPGEWDVNMYIQVHIRQRMRESVTWRCTSRTTVAVE